MAMASTSDIPVASAAVISADTHPYADWAAILAGAFVASAVSITLLTFGSAVGLGVISPYGGSGLSATGLVIAAGLWLCWVQISGFLAGGYLTGRLRRRIGDASEHEVEVRDGSHGLIVWGLGTVALALMTALALTGTAVTGTIAASSAAPDQSYFIDTLLRPKAGAAAAATGGQTTGTPGQAQSSQTRDELKRIMTVNMPARTFDPNDRAYVESLISRESGLTQQEAAARLDATIAKAKAAADRARKMGILYAFLTAASLLLSAVAAWWAAVRGGNHRDQGVDFSHLTSWR